MTHKADCWNPTECPPGYFQSADGKSLNKHSYFKDPLTFRRSPTTKRLPSIRHRPSTKPSPLQRDVNSIKPSLFNLIYTLSYPFHSYFFFQNETCQHHFLFTFKTKFCLKPVALKILPILLRHWKIDLDFE